VLGGLLKATSFALVFSTLALLVAGRIDHPWVNAYLAVLGMIVIAAGAAIDPSLVRERLRQSHGGEDSTRLVLLRVASLATLVIALLDSGRLHRSDTVPGALRVAALAAVAVSMAWSLWAMRSNPFFLPVMAIQAERGHRLITAGPYGIVRHPGYLGMMVFAPATALALGSWLALIPAFACSLLFVRRAAHEDRFLLGRLEGYAGYATAVRHRLVPGVW